MHRLITVLLITSSLICAQSFPSAVATDTTLGVAKDRSSSTLNGAINNSTTTVVVTDGSKFIAKQIITIDSEQMQICSISTNTLTVCGRGFNGTTAASHSDASTVSGNVVAYYHNALKDEVKAVESTLGANLANLPTNIPSGNKQGNGSKFLMAGTVSGTASTLCTDSNGNATTTGCSGGGGSGLPSTSVCSIDDYSPAGDGTTDDSSVFTTAQATCSTIQLTAGTDYAIGTNVTITASINFVAGSKLVIKTGVTAAITGTVVAPLAKVFTMQGTGALTLGTANQYVFPEWFGAVGDGSTDDTAAIQYAISSVTGGDVVLQERTYKITSQLEMASAYVGLVGQGQRSTFITSTATTGTMLYVNGTGGTGCTSPTTQFNRIQKLSLKRSTVATAGKGIHLYQTCGAWVQDVDLVDNVNSVYMEGAQHTFLQRVYIDLTTSSGVTRVGVNSDASTTPNNSSRFDTVVVSCGPGSNTTGLYHHGSVNDLFVRDFETATCDYGVRIDGTNGATDFRNGDIHFYGSTLDQCKVACFLIQNLTGAWGNLEINGGHLDSLITAGSTIGVSVVNSQGVNVHGAQFRIRGTGAIGVKIDANSSNNIVANNQLTMCPTGVQIAGPNNIVAANDFTSQSSDQSVTHISLLSGALRNVLAGNTLSGYATTGISAASGANNNVIYPYSVDTTNIGTATSDSGTGNAFSITPAAVPSASLQGNGSKFLTSSTISGTGSTLCTDAGGAATTSGCSSGGSGYSQIQQAGSNLTQRATVNFSGAVTCTDNSGASRTDCVGATGGAPGGSYSENQYRSGSSTFGAVTNTGPVAQSWTIRNGAILNNFAGDSVSAYIPQNGSVNFRFVTTALSAPPYTIIARLNCHMAGGANAMACGVYLYDGTKIESFEVLNNVSQPSLNVRQSSAVTSGGSSVAGPTAGLVPPSDFVLKIVDNSTNRTFYYYSNGAWVQFFQEASAAFLTPTSVGFGGIDTNSTGIAWNVAELKYWCLASATSCNGL